MRPASLLICAGLVWVAAARGQEAGGGQAQPSTSADTKLLSELKAALERNTREINSLKDQHARELEQLRKQTEGQQKRIAELEQKSSAAPAQGNASPLRPAAAANRAAPNGPAAGGLAADATAAQPANGELDRLRKLTDVQQKQIEVLSQQTKLLADQVKQQEPNDAKLQSVTATLEARSLNAAKRDQELADKVDWLNDELDRLARTPPPLPSTLKQLFLPSQTNETPLSVYATVSTFYNNYTRRKGAGTTEFEEFTPFFLLKLNNRFFLSAETSFSPSGGASLGQAQLDVFINDWLTADIGYFITPIGFWSERLDPSWINKLPDLPLVLRQVIPDGLTSAGFQLRGARYIAGSPFKVEYSIFATNGLGVPGDGGTAAWADLGGVVGTAANVNSAAAYGGRLALWLPARGINFGVSEYVNSPYTKDAGAVMSIWQPYFNYHYRNWDARFEYGNMFEDTKHFIGNNITRNGFYAQLAYRNYQSLNKYLQRLEGVFRFSDAYFHGIDPKLDLTVFDHPQDAPVNRNQYTLGINYYFYPSTILKFAYEFNQEIARSLRDNVFMVQFATNF